MNLEIVDGKRHHCGRMSRNIRSEQKGISLFYVASVHKTIYQHFQRSIICKSAILDGKVVSMGGMQSDFISDTAYVWFAVADGCECIRFSIIKELIKNIRHVFVTKNKIISLTDIDDRIALRMAKFLGFKISQDTSKNYGNRVMMEINKETFRR